MTLHRTANGKLIDMAALRAKNEHVRAAGTIHVNARGDQIDSLGNVIEPASVKVQKKYNDTTKLKADNTKGQ